MRQVIDGGLKKRCECLSPGDLVTFMGAENSPTLMDNFKSEGLRLGKDYEVVRLRRPVVRDRNTGERKRILMVEVYTGLKTMDGKRRKAHAGYLFFYPVNGR